MVTKNYALAAFTIGNGVHEDTLASECAASAFSAKFMGIVVEYDEDDVVEDVFFHLTEALDEGEGEVLDDVVASHDGTPPANNDKELAPAEETDTGYTWEVAVVYKQHFSGASLMNAATLISGGTTEKFMRADGWCMGPTNSNLFPYNDGTNTAQVYVDGSNNIRVAAAGSFAGNPYAFTIWYIKVVV